MVDFVELWRVVPEDKDVSLLQVTCMNKVKVGWWLRTGPAGYLAVSQPLVYQLHTCFIRSSSRTGSKTSCPLSCSNTFVFVFVFVFAALHPPQLHTDQHV